MKRTSRTIPEATKQRAFNLWLSGISYRKIVEATGMSMGAVSKLIENSRVTIPNLNALRDLNGALRDGGSNIYDAIRGGKLLEELNLLNIDLDKLAGYGILAKKISSERDIEPGVFVGSAMRLIALERQIEKPCEDLVKDFESLSTTILEHKETIGQLDREVNALNQDLSLIEDTFTDQGLGWGEGLMIVKDVRDLRAEAELLTTNVDVLEFDVGEEEKKLAVVERTSRRLHSSINQLKREKEALQKKNEALQRKYTFYSNWMRYEAPRIWQHQQNLEDHTKKVTTKLGQLQEENRAMEERYKLFEQRYVEISKNVQDVEARKGSLEKQCLSILETAKKRKSRLEASGQRRLENAKEKAKEVIKDAEAKRDRILAGVNEEKEELHKQVEVLKAENELIKAAGEPVLKELREERKRHEEAEATANKGLNRLSFPNKLRLPKISSLS